MFILQIFTVLQVFNYLCILGKFAVSVVSYYYASLKTKKSQFDNFVVTGGTKSCHYYNLSLQQNCQIDDLLFSV